MAFSSTSRGQLVDMNVTPLVDVMLVLLIIFMVTVPVISHPLQMDFSKGPPDSTIAAPDPIRIRIEASGVVNWNGSPTTLDALQARFATEAALGAAPMGAFDARKQPALEIEADAQAEYEVVAKVLARAQNANLAKIAFVEKR